MLRRIIHSRSSIQFSFGSPSHWENATYDRSIKSLAKYTGGLEIFGRSHISCRNMLERGPKVLTPYETSTHSDTGPQEGKHAKSPYKKLGRASTGMYVTTATPELLFRNVTDEASTSGTE